MRMTIPVRIMASGEDGSDNNNKILPSSTRRKVLSASRIEGGKMHWSRPAMSHWLHMNFGQSNGEEESITQH
jgi:hypothetical protein